MARVVEVVLQIDDRGTATLRRMAAEGGAAATALRTKTVTEFEAMSAAVATRIDTMTTSFLRFASRAGPLLGAIVAGAVVKFGADFESTMSGVRGVTQATEADFAKLTDQARELGATTQFTAIQSADAMEELGKAGFKTTEILTVMPDVLNLAAAGQLEMASAASITSDVIRSMGLAVEDFTHATDLMARTATSSKTTVEELGFAFQDSAPVARSLGVSFEELNVLLGTLANRGFTATRAGTALRRIFSVFLGDLDEGEDGIARYGVQLKRLDDGTVDIAGTFQALAEAGLDANEIMTAFGLRGGPAALQIVNALAGDIPAMRKALQDASGAAKDLAEIRMDNLKGKGLELASALQELALTGFDKITESLQETAASSTGVIRAWASLLARSDVIEGLTRLFRIGAAAATLYAAAIGVGLVRRTLAFADAAIRLSIGIDTSNASMLRGISSMTRFGELSASAKLGFVGLAGAVGAFTYQTTRAILEVTGLDAKITDLFDRAINDPSLAATNSLEALSTLIEKNAEKLQSLGFGDLDVSAELAKTREQLAVLGDDAEASAAKAAASLKTYSTGIAGINRNQLAALNELTQARERIIGDPTTIREQQKLLQQLTRFRQFAVSASAQDLETFRGFWIKAAETSESLADRIAGAFKLQAKAGDAAAIKADEVARKAEEDYKRHEAAYDRLAKTVGKVGIAFTEMGERLDRDVRLNLKAASDLGVDGTLVMHAFAGQIIDTADSLRQFGQQVPASLADLERFVRNLQALDKIGIDLTLDPVEEPPITIDSLIDRDAVRDEFDAFVADLIDSGQIEPPDPTPWQDFWGELRDSATAYVDDIGFAFADMVERGVQGLSTLVGQVLTGQESLAQGAVALVRQVASQAIATLVQWGIQRLILSRLIGATTAAEGAVQYAKGVSLTFVNAFASMAAAPFPLNLTAPGVALAFAAQAAAGASAQQAVGAALAGGLGISGGAAEGGVIRGRSLIQVGEGPFGAEEAIVPLRGPAAARARHALGLDANRLSLSIGQIVVNGSVDRGAARDLALRLYDELDLLIRRRRLAPLGGA